ncbi:MAG TPA: TetR/AcrR family transcriptional regulator [Solirubrobacterales bacterium]|nr:TetR/AcrR family transcriptional regulator [Solirubrobacterales bacterium]
MGRATTDKGARQSEAILDSALRCLGRDGFAATSMGRIATEAGVSKRLLFHYFASREQLFDSLADAVGARLVTQVKEATAGLSTPEEVMAAGFERLWNAVTGNRGLLIAYFGLVTEAVTDERLQPAAARLKDRFRGLIGDLLGEARAQGMRVVIDEGALTTLLLAGVQGLALEWLERGDTPALAAATADFQRLAAAAVAPA